MKLFTTVKGKALAPFAISRNKPESKYNEKKTILPELDSIPHRRFWAS